MSSPPGTGFGLSSAGTTWELSGSPTTGCGTGTWCSGRSPGRRPPTMRSRNPERERLLAEARALAQLDHPNIVRVLDVADDDGRPWMMFEAVPYRFPYRPLSDVVRSDGPLRPEQAAQVGLQVLVGPRSAHRGCAAPRHQAGQHSARPGQPRAARRLRHGHRRRQPVADGAGSIGQSPLYLAPERASGEPATPAADMWSLGAALYAAVGGKGALRPRRYGSRAHRGHDQPAPTRNGGRARPGPPRRRRTSSPASGRATSRPRQRSHRCASHGGSG